MNKTRYGNIGSWPTFNFTLSFVKWSLNVQIISARVAFRPGILTPFVARDATSIISLNFGCSSAWMGFAFASKFKILTSSNIKVTYLIRRYEPLDGRCLKQPIWIRNYLLRELFLHQTGIKSSLGLLCLLAGHDISRQLGFEIGTLCPNPIFSLQLVHYYLSINLFKIAEWPRTACVDSLCRRRVVASFTRSFEPLYHLH